MSYRNPQQVVDTQSGQHIRNLQKTIAGVAVDVIDTFSKEEKIRKAKEEADNKEWDRLQKVQSDNAINAGANYNKNAQSNFFSLESTGKALNGYGDRYAELKAKTNRTAQEKIEFTNLTSLSSTLKDGMTTIGSQVGTIGVDLANMGNMGGAARGQTTRGGKFSMGMNNQIPGKKWFDVDNSMEGGSRITYHFQEEGSDDIISYTSQQLKDIQNTPGASIYEVIPNETKNIEKLIKDGKFRKVEMGVVKNTLNDAWYEGGEISKKAVAVGGYMVKYQSGNKATMAKSLEAGALVNIESLTDNQQVSFGNYLNEQLKIEGAEIAYGEPLSKDQKDIIAVNYARLSIRDKIGDSKKIFSKVKIQTPSQTPTNYTGLAKNVIRDAFKNVKGYLNNAGYTGAKVNGSKITIQKDSGETEIAYRVVGDKKVPYEKPIIKDHIIDIDSDKGAAEYLNMIAKSRPEWQGNSKESRAGKQAFDDYRMGRTSKSVGAEVRREEMESKFPRLKKETTAEYETRIEAELAK